MLKTVYLKGYLFHDYRTVVELSVFDKMDDLIYYIREKLKALFTTHNLPELYLRVDQMDIKPDIHFSIQEMMLSTEHVINLVCRKALKDETPEIKELYLS